MSTSAVATPKTGLRGLFEHLPPVTTYGPLLALLDLTETHQKALR